MHTDSENVELTPQGDQSKERERIVAFEKLVDWFIETDPWQVRRYVEGLRERYPDVSDDELAGKVVSLKSIKNGLVGAATGVPGFLAFPIAIPADVITSWKIQINMAMCIAQIYGHTLDPSKEEIKTDIFMILAGSGAKESLHLLGVEVDQVTKKAIRRYVTREVTIELWKHLGRRIIRTTGLRSMHRMSRVVPLVGAPIGFAFDYAATRSVGEAACDYYRPACDPIAA
jgi:uncharacterized protein (DUF697 family)